MGSRSRTLMWASGLLAVSFIFCLISFVSPYWLETDGKLDTPKFVRLGLWEVCFRGFEHPRHWYRTVFNSCWWVFEEEYYIIHDFLLPGFFVATQFFYTLTITFCLMAFALFGVYFFVEGTAERYILLLLTVGALIVAAGVCGFVSVVTFGARGDGRDWMPNWEHNHLGWAFAFGVIGDLLLFPAGILFLIEARVNKYKRLNEIHSREQSAYDMEERKVRYGGAHTDI